MTASPKGEPNAPMQPELREGEALRRAVQAWADGKVVMFDTDVELVEAVNEALAALAASQEKERRKDEALRWVERGTDQTHVLPYGRQIRRWTEKAWTEAPAALIVALVPSRTDSAWWHDYVMPASEIRFLRGRLKFSGAEHNAPFPSTVVVWSPDALT